MNYDIAFNFIVFAAFLSAFVIEVGLALLLLFDYSDKAKIMKYLIPVWEINGTFAIFYIVDTEATFPAVLVPLGFLYIIPIMFAGIAFIFRNSFFGYSEFMSNKINEKRYIIVYAISTVIVAFLALSVLNSTVSGIGVNVASSSLNLLNMLFNPYNIMMFLGEAAFAIFADVLIFKIKREFLYSIIAIILAFIFIIGAMFIGNISYFLGNVKSELYYLILPIILIIISFFAYKFKDSFVKFIVPFTVFISILSFEFLEYPGLFNNTLPFKDVLVSSIDQPLVLIFGIVGGLILFASLAVVVYLNVFAKDPKDVDQNKVKQPTDNGIPSEPAEGQK